MQPVYAFAPPDAYLARADDVQYGNIRTYCWNEMPIIQSCYKQDFFVFPKPILQGHGSASILIEKGEPPDRVSVRYWTAIERDQISHSTWFDRPKGSARYIHAELSPAVTQSGLGWKATFDLDETGPVFLAAHAHWTVDAACPACGQWVVWTFSLRE